MNLSVNKTNENNQPLIREGENKFSECGTTERLAL